ncbi:sigma-70 family RNA polymerase sigma factor [Massilia sp. P8910]|uniref:sigma-70 family RNA polymerase sigma factor n=1 Tax=Massilia antarctica TaxID=2765360 RepID=UPI001E2C3214|nr:sigma-70 family RNA polymerase sigma factor [Massilia antarctica]MCE3602802.1 sigma-70 family RNA polymerase sigma factor [Massilia antarctica]
MTISLPRSATPSPGADIADLWRGMREAGGDAVRERIVAFYLPFARMLTAKAFARRTFLELEFVDFLQYAAIGLIEAVDRFDPARAIKFETFATPRINGAILNGIATFTEKQEQVRARQRVTSERVASVKERDPASAGADDLFVYLAELAVDLALGFILDSADEMPEEVSSYPDNTYRRIEMAQLGSRVKALVDGLPDKERKVVNYHYMQQLPFDEVAAIMNLSKGRVSQLHRSAIGRLRESIDISGQIDLSC